MLTHELRKDIFASLDTKTTKGSLQFSEFLSLFEVIVFPPRPLSCSGGYNLTSNLMVPNKCRQAGLRVNIIIRADTRVGVVSTQIAHCYATCLPLIGFLPLYI